MAKLFERSSIKSLELKNRLVRSATHEGMSDESGCPTPNLFNLYRRLAQGGVGLITTGYAYVSKDGISPFYRMQAIDRDEIVDKYRKLVDHVHQNGTKVAMQIVHCGRQTFESVIGTQPIAPSAVRDNDTGVIPREMTEEDIERVIDDFSQGARRVKEAGFDAVQIHCAHGYLLSSFVSPYTNRRTDRWGGTTENRVRIVQEIYSRCRAQVGDQYPLMIKYSCRDKMEGGLSREEGLTVGRMLAEMGFDCIEVSAGIFEDGGSTLFGDAPLGTIPPQAYNLESAKSLKNSIDIPVMLVGGISDPAIMQDIVAKGYVDYISMSRALICDPKLPGKMENKNSKPVECCHCNLCTGYCSTRPLRCYYGKKLKNHEPILEHTLVLKNT